MDSAQATLFDDFPRRVGTPVQHFVYNRAWFDLAVEECNGRRNLYATVGQIDLDETLHADKVYYDLDGDKSVFDEDETADERVRRMREDPDVADDVLGDVMEDARNLAYASRDDGIPVMGVLSGFGMHVHQLYEKTSEPKVPMASVARKYISEVGLDTADWSVAGQAARLCRIPNAERVTSPGDRHEVQDGRGTGLFCVPFRGKELVELTVGEALEASKSPRDIVRYRDEDRPPMPLWEEYREPGDEKAENPPRPVDDHAEVSEDAEELEWLLEELLKMPCMVERIQQPNPEHEVRLNCSVMLFNAGLSPREVADLYSRLGWVDFDRETTLRYLRQAWNKGYSDMSCKTIREEKRLCVRTENPVACPCYGWGGGNAEWQERTET